MWTGYSATINPAEGGECPSLTRTVTTTGKAIIAAKPVAAAATTVVDKSCTRAAAANDKTAVPD